MNSYVKIPTDEIQINSFSLPIHELVIQIIFYAEHEGYYI